MRTQQSANTVTSETKVSVPTLTMAATLLLGREAQSQRCRWIAASTRSDCLFPLWKCRGPTRRQSLAALTERLQRPCSPLDGALSAPRLARPFKVWTTACFVAERFAGTSTRAGSRSRGMRPSPRWPLQRMESKIIFSPAGPCKTPTGASPRSGPWRNGRWGRAPSRCPWNACSRATRRGQARLAAAARTTERTSNHDL